MNVFVVFFILSVIGINANKTCKNDLKGKVAVVTGGAKGIGYAIAENYLKNGVRVVVIVDKNLIRGLDTEKTFKKVYGADRVSFIHGDVTTDLYPVSNIIFGTYGYVDVLVNNAGIVDEYDPVRTIRTNLIAPVLWSETFFNAMRKDRGGKGGTIMNVASILAYTREPFMTYYKSAKFGVLGLSVGLGHEYRYMTSGVRVFAICPGYTYTDLLKNPIVLDEDREILNKLLEASTGQEPDAVGRASVCLYKCGTTGMAYTIKGGELFVAPDSVNITAEYLLSLQ